MPSFSPHSSHVYFCLLGASHTLEVRARPVPARRGVEGGLTRSSRATQMGCGGSKPEEAGGAVAKPEEVDLSPVKKEKRMSMTKRRVAVRCAGRGA